MGLRNLQIHLHEPFVSGPFRDIGDRNLHRTKGVCPHAVPILIPLALQKWKG